MGRATACAVHLDRLPAFSCSNCRLPYCEACIDHRFEGKGFVDRCRRCQERVEAIPVAPAAGAQTLMERLGEAPRFAFSRPILGFCLALSAITAPITWAAQNNIFGFLGRLGAIIVLGLELSLFFHAVNHTAAGGDAETLTTPSYSDVWDDIYGPVLRLVVAFLPFAFAALILYLETGDLAVELIPQSALALGATISAGLLFPLLLVLAATGTAADVLNPLQWARAMSGLGASYFVVAPLVLVLVAAYLVWGAVSVPLLAIPLLGRVFALAAGYVLMAMVAKLLGLLLEPHLSRHA